MTAPGWPSHTRSRTTAVGQVASGRPAAEHIHKLDVFNFIANKQHTAEFTQNLVRSLPNSSSHCDSCLAHAAFCFLNIIPASIFHTRPRALQGRCLLEAVGEKVGAEFTEEVKAAWSKAFDTTAEVAIAASPKEVRAPPSSTRRSLALKPLQQLSVELRAHSTVLPLICPLPLPHPDQAFMLHKPGTNPGGIKRGPSMLKNRNSFRVMPPPANLFEHAAGPIEKSWRAAPALGVFSCLPRLASPSDPSLGAQLARRHEVASTAQKHPCRACPLIPASPRSRHAERCPVSRFRSVILTPGT